MRFISVAAAVKKKGKKKEKKIVTGRTFNEPAAPLAQLGHDQRSDANQPLSLFLLKLLLLLSRLLFVIVSCLIEIP